ncbi:reverse transcriptase domain-containing protein [Cyanothece sp. BG0011]|uniref:reverse transcriptase domain-containing protein n=1 Tax=Cyanothece sp. BG0011 TaxID=2082950 RepID=UPI0035136FAD
MANIALNGIEKIGEFRSRGITYSKCVRYADDMVYVLKQEDDAESILAEVEEFLAQRGMEISQKKT